MAAPLPPKLAHLLQSYEQSEIAAAIRAEIEAFSQAPPPDSGVTDDLPDVAEETSALRSRQRASYTTQFRILSGRAFKNLYRNPALLAAHYASSIGIAREFVNGLRLITHFLTPVFSNMRFPFP